MAELKTQKPKAATSEAERSLVMEHVFKAPPAEVFRAWTDPAILKKWWAPEGFTTPDVAMDIRSGGAWHSTMISPEGEHFLTNGVFREVVPNRRIVMTWAWVEKGARGHETIVDVTLEPAGKGTRLKLVQRVFETKRDVEVHSWGWKSSFAILDGLFAAQG